MCHSSIYVVNKLTLTVVVFWRQKWANTVFIKKDLQFTITQCVHFFLTPCTVRAAPHYTVH